MANKNADRIKPLSLVWLRRDLRLYDHAALQAALDAGGEVQPVFIFDTDILARFDNPRDRRLSFIAHALCSIHAELRTKGGGLLVLHGRAAEIMPRLMAEINAQRLFVAEDFEPETIKRDEAVAARVPLTRVVDHLIHHPQAVVKPDGSAYRVFTPYAKAWRAALTADSYDEKVVTLDGRLADYGAVCAAMSAQCIDPSQGVEAMLRTVGYEAVPLDAWPVDGARQRLLDFMDMRLADYKEQRDFMAREGTSQLSPYLRFGLVSVRECARLAAQTPCKGSDSWLNELIWREFYAMILYHYPEVVNMEFQPQYRGLGWHKDDKLFEAFCMGRTGYPIVDAAMRQLLETGWMHNRARMVVASFMTKDLHLDWRLGEAHFAQYLMDYELASNNGGWQWAASVGTDAQPYFRIFNPQLQSERFDPSGDYIRRYVPELRHLCDKALHAPKQDLFGDAGYPAPIVEHQREKAVAIEMFKQVGRHD